MAGLSAVGQPQPSARLNVLFLIADDLNNDLGTYGPELALPREINYQVISRQGQPMHDGFPTPGAFDGMGAFPGQHGTTILIRNHENRERLGEVPVISTVPYDPTVRGGNTKLVVRREQAGLDADGQQLYVYSVENSFTILGGTSTNCAGGIVPGQKWITCEEVVKGPAFGPSPNEKAGLRQISSVT